VVRDALIEIAVDVGLLDILDALQQPVAQRADALVLARHLGLRQARRFTEAALVTAAVDLRLDAHARLAPYVQGADALRAVDLVRGDGEQVDLELLHVDLDTPRALHRVAVEDDALRAAQLADLPDRLHYADLVVH